MEIYGISGIRLKWLESYLTNRRQHIQIRNIKNTDLKDVVCGVSPWSVLGPLLFCCM